MRNKFLLLSIVFTFVFVLIGHVQAQTNIGDGSKYVCEDGKVKGAKNGKELNKKKVNRVFKKRIKKVKRKLKKSKGDKKAQFKELLASIKSEKSEAKECLNNGNTGGDTGGDDGGDTGSDPVAVPDSGSATATITEKNGTDTATCIFMWSVSEAQSAQPLVAGSTKGVLSCTFSKLLTVTGHSFFLVPAADGAFGKVFNLKTIFGGSDSEMYVSDIGGGSPTTDAETAASALYGNEADGVKVKKEGGLEVTVNIDGGGSYSGAFGTPVS